MVELDKILSERSDDRILLAVKEISEHDFSRLVESILGYLELKILRSRPRESFVIADCVHRPDSNKYTVFFSRRDEPVTRADIESLASYMERADTQNALVLTTSSIMADAIPLADSKKIGTADGVKLSALMRRFDLDKEVIRAADARKEKTKVVAVPGMDKRLGAAMAAGYEAMADKDLMKALDAFDRAILVDDSYDVPWRMKGNVLDEMGYHEQALECYRHALELLPESGETWFSLGNCFFALGRFNEELMCYDRALFYNPSMQKALINKGSTLHRLGRFKEALDSFDKVLKLNYRLEKVHSNRGATLHSLGRGDEALDSYNRALELKHDYVEGHTNKGNLLFEMGRYEDALESFTRITQIRPENSRGWYLKGIASKKLGKNAQAKNAFEQAMRLDPEFADARKALDEETRKMADQMVEVPRIVEDIFATEASRGRGAVSPAAMPSTLPEDVVARVKEENVEKLAEEIYGDRAELLMLMGRLDEALEFLGKSLRLEGESPYLLTAAGNVLYRIGKREAAIKSYEHALASDPSYVPALFNLHTVLMDTRDPEGASKLSDALRKTSSGWQGRAVAAMDACRQGDHRQALEDLEFALAIENLSMLHNYKGLVKLASDDFAGAAESFERNQAASLDVSEAHNNAGISLFKKGDLERASLEIDKAIRILKINPAAWNNRGCILYRGERMREAIACFEESLVISPTTVAMNNKGFCQLSIDMLPEALQTFEQSVKIAETAEAYNDKGLVLRRMGRMPEAQVAFNESLRVAPQFKDAAANSKLPAEDGKKSEPAPDPTPQPAPPPPPQPVVVGGEAPERMPLAEVTAVYLREMRKIELEALCDSLGLNSRGTKNELISRILRAKEKARRK